MNVAPLEVILRLYLIASINCRYRLQILVHFLTDFLVGRHNCFKFRHILSRPTLRTIDDPQTYLLVTCFLTDAVREIGNHCHR